MNLSSSPRKRSSSSSSLSSDFGNESENITLSNKVSYRRRSKDKPLKEPLARTPTPTGFLKLLEQNKSCITELLRERQQGAENCLVRKDKKKFLESKEQDA